jgi:hypothetical protein
MRRNPRDDSDRATRGFGDREKVQTAREWWSTTLPWRSLNWRLPVASVKHQNVSGIVVHRQGQYGRNRGDWVSGDRLEEGFHFGLDIIGWIGDSGLSQPLDGRVVCGSPLEGIVEYVEQDEHDHLSVVVTHSSVRAKRVRFSFFGDLEKVYVKKRQKVGAGAPLGRPYELDRRFRFFHFGIGYAVRVKGEWQRYYIDPRPSIDGKIEIRGRVPWIQRGLP